jgi:hypothetical protein
MGLLRGAQFVLSARQLTSRAAVSRPAKQPPPLGTDVFRPPRQPAHESELELQQTETPDASTEELIEVYNPDAPAGPEYAGPRGYEPTRFGDWSKNGRVSDF